MLILTYIIQDNFIRFGLCACCCSPLFETYVFDFPMVIVWFLCFRLLFSIERIYRYGCANIIRKTQSIYLHLHAFHTYLSIHTVHCVHILKQIRMSSVTRTTCYTWIWQWKFDFAKNIYVYVWIEYICILLAVAAVETTTHGM